MKGIYETILCENGSLINFNDHYQRLKKSAKELNIKFPHSKKALLHKIIVPKGKSRLRIDITNSKISFKFSEITPIISNNLVTYKAERPTPKHKLSDRTIEDKALKFARSQNAIDAILVDNNGNLTEGSISNFFIVINKTIITPKLNILPGIMRKQVIKNAHVKFRNIKLKDIEIADEIFITNSIKGIVPISKINNHDKLLFPGPITKLLCEKLI